VKRTITAGSPATLGERLRKAKKAAKLSNSEIAAAAGVHEKTVSRWLNDVSNPDPVELDRAAGALGVTSTWLRYGDETGEERADAWTPNPRYRNRLPPRAYATVYGHLEAMRAAGASEEQLDEAERVMVDGAYNKLNTRDVRTRTEDELVTDIESAWLFIREVLTNGGMKGL